jgi:hypothetical protein
MAGPSFHVRDRNNQYAIRLIDVKHRVREDGGKVSANGRIEKAKTFRVLPHISDEMVDFVVKAPA